MAEIEAAGGTAAACHLDVTQEATYETLFSAFSMAVTGLNFISIVLLEIFPIVLRRVLRGALWRRGPRFLERWTKREVGRTGRHERR